MRILMLSWEFPPKNVGGLARHVNDISQAMSEEGHEVHIITSAVEGAPSQEFKNGIHIHRVNPYTILTPGFINWTYHLNMAMIEKTVSLMNEVQFDIIHAHDWLVAFVGRALKHAYKIPLVATIHATEAGRNGGLHTEEQQYINSIEWFLTYEAWEVIVCSEHMKNEVKGLFGLPDDKLRVIPNGIFSDKFKISEEEKISLDYLNEDDKVVLFVGRLVQEKGIHVLLDAVPKILQSVPNAKFVVAGKGPMEDTLKHMASGLGDRVHFTGYVSDQELKTLYDRAETAVFPSLYEPFGIVALEAMAAETPLVVSDTGGFSEIVEHGKNGLKFYNGNANSLADNVSAALADDNLQKTLIKNAISSINNEYDWKSIASKTISLYKDILEEYANSKWSSYRDNVYMHPEQLYSQENFAGGEIH